MKRWNAAKAKRQLDKLWSAYIKQRDGFCQFCFRVEGMMNAHHLFSRRHTATRWEPNNGVLVCYTCHNTAHNDIEWGHDRAVSYAGTIRMKEMEAASRQIKPFDRAYYAAKLVELRGLLK